MRVKTWLNAGTFEKKGEVNNLPSMTVPDQSMTIKEIMDKYTRGIPVNAAKVPIYDEDDDMPDLRTLDISEIADLRHQYEAELQETTTKLKNSKKPPKQAEIPDKGDEKPTEPDGDETKP